MFKVTYDKIEYEFNVGGYFKLATDQRFYLIRGVTPAGDLWLDLFDIKNGEGVLFPREANYGYTVDVFSWRLKNHDIIFSDAPFVPIAASPEEPQSNKIKPPTPTEQGKRQSRATPKGKKNPPATGTLF